MSPSSKYINEKMPSQLIMFAIIPLLMGTSFLDAQTGRRLAKKENRTRSEDVIIIPGPAPEPAVDSEIDIIIDDDLIHWEFAQVIEVEPVEPLEPLEPLEPHEGWGDDEAWELIQNYEIHEEELLEHAREAKEHAREQARHAVEQARLAGEQRARRFVRWDSEEWQQV
jgi:hypothetical protein